jgi:hypothetical protein
VFEKAQNGIKRIGERRIASEIEPRCTRGVGIIPATEPPIDVDVGLTTVERVTFKLLWSAGGLFAANPAGVIDEKDDLHS